MAAELWISAVPKTGSGVGTTDVLNVRSSNGFRGPTYGLRPLCSASIWYIGRPTGATIAGTEMLPFDARDNVPQAVAAVTASMARGTSPERRPSTGVV